MLVNYERVRRRPSTGCAHDGRTPNTPAIVELRGAEDAGTLKKLAIVRAASVAVGASNSSDEGLCKRRLVRFLPCWLDPGLRIL